MRLREKNQTIVKHYELIQMQSGYVGMEKKLHFKSDINATVQPISDKFTIEIYGAKTASMRQIFLSNEVPVCAGDFIKIGSVFYRVVEHQQYTMHQKVVVEKDGNDYQEYEEPAT